MNSRDARPATSASYDLEIQLSHVIERDGVTMLTSEGVRRRAKRTKKTPRQQSGKTNIARAEISLDESSEQVRDDHITQLDVEHVGIYLHAGDAGRETTITIIRAPHEQSDYVVSLRGVLNDAPSSEVSPAFLMHESSTFPTIADIDPHVFQTLSRDLVSEGYNPHIIAEQFTASHFSRSYRNVYGRAERFRIGLRLIRESALDFFTTVPQQRPAPVREISEPVIFTRPEIEDPEPAIPFLMPHVSIARVVVALVALLFVVTIPAHAVGVYRSVTQTARSAEDESVAALREVSSAQSAGSVPGTAEALRRASSHFREADGVLSESRALALGLASVMPDTYRSARALLEVGDKASDAGRLLAQAFETIFEDPHRRLDERLDVFVAYAHGVAPLLDDAVSAAARIDPSTVPESKRASIATLSERLELARNTVQEFAGMAELLSVFAGKDRARTYLLVFQNNTELRPTGGFMGSMAEVVVDRGKIQKMNVPSGGTYGIKGQLLSHVIAPQPLHLINPHWQFQDSNWSPDFPTAANKMRWFWSQSGQPSIDGVIAVNASFVERVLELTGPIELPQHGKTIDASNFFLETQKAVELEYDKTANEPKKILGDMAEVMKERIGEFDKNTWLQFVGLLSDALESKDIQIASMHEDEEARIEQYGWNGRIKDTPGDALAIIEANIAGQKTDAVIDEQTRVTTSIDADGHIINDVQLVRTHAGKKGELFRGVRNVSYIRWYVPEGSELLEASGFHTPPSALFKKPDDDYVADQDVSSVESDATQSHGIDVMHEGTRTVFGGWAQLDPGRMHILRVRYRLPFTIQDLRQSIEPNAPDSGAGSYTMLLTSQAGKSDRMLTTSFKLSPEWKTTWSREGTEYSGVWDRDRVIAAFLSPTHGQKE